MLSRTDQRATRRLRPAAAADVTFALLDDGSVWLDVAGRAGVRFTPAEWAAFTGEAVAMSLDARLHTPQRPMTT
ncbi:MAG TPA: hypothetical protein VFP61_07635 [Acidimicrobiales bacterium]|nr:hypothetical protein [Acidimicrobiales bacterium]